jgi:hypothetical protein
VDEGFIDRLSRFLASGDESHSIRLDEMSSGTAEFDAQLAHFSRVGTQYGLRVYKTRSGLNAVIPGSMLSIQHTAGGGTDLVEVPWIQSALQIEPFAQETVRTLLFEEGKLPNAIPGVSLKPELVRVHDVVDGPILIQGGVERDVVLTARLGEIRASAKFHARPLSDEVAYTHPAGFAFVFSSARQHDDGWVHEFELRLFKGELPLSETRRTCSGSFNCCAPAPKSSSMTGHSYQSTT